jgi:hypothetical protein
MDMFDFSENSKSYKMTVAGLSVVVGITLLIALVPSWRAGFQNLMWAQDRVILAKTQGHLNPRGPNLTVFKIRTKEGLFIEIYKGNDTETEKIGQHPLEGSQDGYFNIHSQASNLVLTDVDEDGYMDIVAPTFDELQQARMNIFRYDTDAQTYVRMEKTE